MPEQIISASGQNYGMNVNPDGSINIGSMPPISVSANTGSQAYLYGMSGNNWYPLLSTSGTIGTLVTNANVSVTTGSQVWINGGSVQTFNPIGIGSVLVTNTVPISGIVNQGTNPWVITGSVAISNSISVSTGSAMYVVAGSTIILSSTGSVGVYSPSTLAVSGIVSQGTNPWIVNGSFAITNIGSVTITNALASIGSISQQTISGNVGILGIGSSLLVSSAGSVGVYATLIPISGVVNQGTSPWITLGSTNISNFKFDTGSWIYTVGSIVSMPSISISTGSAMYVVAGSTVVLSSAGSVGVYSPSTLAISGIVNQGTNPWIVLGSFAITNIGSVTLTNSLQSIGSFTGMATGSTYIVSSPGSIGVYASDNMFDVNGSIYVIGSINVINQYLGSESWIRGGSSYVTGSINIATALIPISGLTRMVPYFTTGSVLVSSGTNLTLGSTLLTSMLNTINWIAVRVSGNAPGSVYAFGVKDSEGYLMQSLLQHTGDWTFLSPLPASGTVVYTISGTTASGTYFFRTSYS